jgi:hypothetical protein
MSVPAGEILPGFAFVILESRCQDAADQFHRLGNLRRLSERRSLTLTNDLRDSEHCLGCGRRSPGSLFDGRYKGLTGHAARLDEAIRRQQHLRRVPSEPRREPGFQR